MLWFVVLGSRKIEETKEIPLEIVTAPDLVPANDVPDRVSVRFEGPKAFMRVMLDRRESPIRINLTGAKPGLVTYRIFSDSVKTTSFVKVLSINPTAVLVKLEPVKRKDVPVRVELRGAPPEGYRIVGFSVKPPLVTIKGPESRTENVAEVLAVPIDVSKLNQTTERELVLDMGRPNLYLDGSPPVVKVEVEAISANFKIKNVDVRVAADGSARAEEASVTVLVRATQQDLARLDRSKVYATVDARGLKKGRHRLPVKVSLPEGVGLVKVLPEFVHVQLR